MPAMERLFQQMKQDGLVMLAVSVDADPNAIAPFLAEHAFMFTIGLDPKMELADAYGVRALPASFLVDREGYVVASALGPRDWDNPASRALVAALSR
jgi:peroxiredoxin